MARKKEEMEVEVDEGTEPRVYELGFHHDPELSESDAKAAYETIRDAITSGGTLVAEGEPEKVQLAYTISRTETSGRRDFDSAYFCWIAYEADGNGHEAALNAVKAEKRVVRFIDLRTTKDAAKHAAEMREMRTRAPEPKEATDAELDAALEEATA